MIGLILSSTLFLYTIALQCRIILHCRMVFSGTYKALKTMKVKNDAFICDNEDCIYLLMVSGFTKKF